MDTNDKLSRRDFLTTTGTLAAGSVLTGPMSGLIAQAASPKKRPVKIAELTDLEPMPERAV